MTQRERERERGRIALSVVVASANNFLVLKFLLLKREKIASEEIPLKCSPPLLADHGCILACDSGGVLRGSMRFLFEYLTSYFTFKRNN